MSSLVPKCRQPVGHAFTQGGSRATSSPSTQRVHFAILPVLMLYLGMSKGQPVSHSLQPMHASGFTSTMPFSYCTMAPGAGQAARQPGSEQCMHWSLRISQAIESPSGRSSKRIRFQKLASVFGIVWYVPICVVFTTPRSFHYCQGTHVRCV